MAGSAEQALSQFQAALKSGDINAINNLIGGNPKTNLARSFASAKPPGTKTNATTPSAANVEILDTVTSDDTIVARFRFNVKGSDVAGADPSKTARGYAIAIAKLQNGKVTSVNIEPDTTGLFLQLGLGVSDAKPTQ